MRGICFKEFFFDLIANGSKTVTRRMKDTYKVGEILYIKEPYFLNEDGSVDYCYRGTTEHKWKNKLFMPQKYARMFIQIVDKRQEHLQEITEEECFLEGIKSKVVAGYFDKNIWSYYFNGVDLICYSDAIDAFAALIDEINGRGTWDKNPVVTRYEFELLK